MRGRALTTGTPFSVRRRIFMRGSRYCSSMRSRLVKTRKGENSFRNWRRFVDIVSQREAKIGDGPHCPRGGRLAPIRKVIEKTGVCRYDKVFCMFGLSI
jgi:hypothetical protein